MMNFDSDDMNVYKKTLKDYVGIGSYSYSPKNLGLDLKIRHNHPTKPLIEEPLVLELKIFPGHLRYALSDWITYYLILSWLIWLSGDWGLVSVMWWFKRAITSTFTDIIKIPPMITTYKIQLEAYVIPSIEH